MLVRPLALAAALASLAVVPATASAQRQPSSYVLPGPTVYPEGITTRPGTDEFYVSSTQGGAIFRGVLGRPRMRVFLRPGRDGRNVAVGVRATRNRLVVLGGPLNLVWVYELPSGRLLRRFSTPAGGLLNDVAINPAGDVYLTDSPRSQLFRIPARALKQRRGGTQPLRPFLRFSNEQAPGGYANGIVPDGRRHLIVGFLSSGRLLRIDLRTRRVRRIAVRGTDLPVIDGLARDGRTLFVVNSASRVTELRLSANGLRATLRRQITANFLLPSTVALLRGRLLVVNYQLGDPTPVLPFTVSSLRRP